MFEKKMTEKIGDIPTFPNPLEDLKYQRDRGIERL